MNRAALEAEVKKALKSCVACGACMAVCPVYRTRRREEVGARSKLAVLEACLSGGLEYNDKAHDILSSCLLCGRCQANCPNTAASTDAIRAGRELLAAGHTRGGLKRLALGNTLPHRSRMDLAARAAGAVHPLARPLVEAAQGLFSGIGLRIGGLDLAKALPRPPARPYLAHAPRVAPGPKHGPRIAFFVGCVTNYLRPELAAHAVDLLSRIGEVWIPPRQLCCGLPALAAGLGDTARDLARANLDALAATEPDLVVTACGSCAHTLAREMPRLLGQEAAQSISAKVKEISQVLAEHLDTLELSPRTPGPVAVHDPCHLKIGMGVSQEPRDILKAAGVEVVEMRGADQCCGGGGLFAVNNPELSREVFAPRAEALAQSQARILATSCSGCYLQWLQGLQGRCAVAHPIELVESGA